MLKRLVVGLSVALYILSTSSALAETSVVTSDGSAVANVRSGEVVSDIIVEGNQRIEKDTILAQLSIHSGDVFRDESIDASLKRLFGTGLFSDVRIERRLNTLVIKVVENPILNKIAYEGNKRIEDEALEKEILLKPRSVYTRTKVQNDVKRILALYQRNGRFSAAVVPKVIQLPQNRVNLVFEIEEGAVTEIKRIDFLGNKVYDDAKLGKVISSREDAWFRFFSSDDKYDPERMQYDQELLRQFYVDHGYADFQVTSAVAELTPEKDAFYLTYTVEEGALYNFGDIKVNSRIRDVSADDLMERVNTDSGEHFSSKLIEVSIDNMIAAMGDKGYAFVDVEPQIDRQPSTNTINITYEVKEGPRVYVERINVNGNVRTLDKVVRREFRLSEGDAYSTSKLQRSEERVRNLGFFERVKVSTSQGSAPDRVVIDIDVMEKSTGELSFGAGFSSVDGALADISLQENNLLGAGKSVRANMMIASKRQQIDLGYTEPYFLGRNMSAGVDVFKTAQDFRTESSYDRESLGGALRLSYAMSEYLNHSLRYSLRNDDISNIDASASRFIRDQEGKYTTSLVGHALMYDRRDNRFDPTSGYYVRLSQDFAGLGGDAKYVRNELRSGYFMPVLKDDWVLQFLGRGGYIWGWDQDVRINDRFFKGGRDLRGFDSGGIGARDITTGDALGGNIYYSGTVELMFPLGFGEESTGFRGAIFGDVASLWDVSNVGPEVVDEASPRVAIGAGLAWSSPFGPIRIDFAHALVKEDFDKTETIRFSFGTRF